MRNATVAARVYAHQYPDRRHPTAKVFLRTIHRLRTTGNVRLPVFRRQRRGRTEDNIINVLAYVEFNPHLSTRTIAHDLGVNRTTVQNILKEYRFHPYHLVLHQELSAQDFDRRLDHCHWLLGMIVEDPQVLSNILWTDEATFHSNGDVNLHNIHYWSPTNPHCMREVQHQGRWSLNCWAGILGGRIIGQFFFNNGLNGANYLQFLREELPILLEDVPLEIRQRMMFQHGGCPAHFARNVREFLDATYPGRWIGRGGTFPWPARSPDLTCLDFYLWGRVKEIVFATRPTTRQNMIGRIRDCMQTLSFAEVETAALSTEQKMFQCIENDGMHF
ncbi:uncharacterized protein LOC126736370 [Anthonomus grandis grandis]|uniref:uncharacterized protein LOC126736370 n=1 Tax=Anthonomus grandis grandis TaxID=2921223 RepID=UPI002164F350|nr:uncharacterized protein LOC126736370 [Anthonomus grandis grandis]